MNLNDLLPKAADIQKAKVEGFVHSTLSRLARDLGAPPDVLRQIKNNPERYDVSTFSADFPGFPWALQVDRVSSYNVKDLFVSPTKSPVFSKFSELFPDWRTEKVLLFFKAADFTTLVIGTVPYLSDCSIVLKGAVKKTNFYITTYAEFIDVVGPLKLLEA